jgi:hypothetical protein
MFDTYVRKGGDTTTLQSAATCPTCGSIDTADSGRCRDKFHRSIIDLVNALPAPFDSSIAASKEGE